MSEEEYNIHIEAAIDGVKKTKSEASQRNSRNKKVGNHEENKVAKKYI